MVPPLWTGRFGQGAASWWRNLRGLALGRAGGEIYTIDWLGVGLSSRPVWGVERDTDPVKAEAWFVDSLEAWRKAKGIKKMHLVILPHGNPIFHANVCTLYGGPWSMAWRHCCEVVVVVVVVVVIVFAAHRHKEPNHLPAASTTSPPTRPRPSLSHANGFFYPHQPPPPHACS